MQKPTLGYEYLKPKRSGKKPSDGGKQVRKKQETEKIVDRNAKRIRIGDPNCDGKSHLSYLFDPCCQD